MKKQDEIYFFNYLYGYCEANNTKQPRRDTIELFEMNEKRRYKILEKWATQGIWEYGINAFGGWFEPNALEIFNKNQQRNNMEKIRSCPKCGSTKIMTERRIDGDSKCSECGYKDKTGNFTFELPTFKQYLKMNGNEAILKEEKQDTKGIYVAVKYNQSAGDDLLDFIKKYNIPSTLKAEDFHTTLIYSRKWAEINDLDDNMGDSEIVAYPKELHVFETFDKKRALVIKLDCPYLDERHKYLMQKYNLTYDYDEYIPHITLSYDIADMEIPKDVEFPEFFRIESEYKEELNIEKKY